MSDKPVINVIISAPPSIDRSRVIRVAMLMLEPSEWDSDPPNVQIVVDPLTGGPDAQ